MTQLGFKFKELAPAVESLLFEEYLADNRNWVTDWQLKLLAKQKKDILEKEDSFRRVADDLCRLGKAKKLKGKAMYKHVYCPDQRIKGKVVALTKT